MALDNTATPALNDDVGFKISQPGYNARTAPAAQQVFNSSWPSLSVAFTKQVSYSAAAQNIAHGLKITPFTMIWVADTVLDQSSYTVASRGAMRYFPDVDGTNVYIPGGISANYFQTVNSVIHIKCFNIDLTKDVDYPLLKSGDGYRGGYDADYGIKLIKAGKDINSRDLRDYILHSRAQAPLIMAVKTQATMNPANITTIQYTNKLGYPSWNYGFVKTSTNRYSYAPFFNQAYPKTTTDGITTTLPWAGTDIGATLVILRDPLFPTNKVDVTY